MDSILDVCSTLSIGDGMQLDFIGKSNIWIDNTYEEDVIGLARNIIYEALENTAAGQLDIVGYDSDLSGIFAPFASLSSGEMKQFTFLSSLKELKEWTGYIRQQIVDVQNVIQGRAASLLKFRKQIGRAVEGYRLVVLSLDMGMISTELRGMLSMLFRSGPAFGVSFLIISTTEISVRLSSGKEVELAVRAIAPNTGVLHVDNRKVTREDTGRSTVFHPRSAEQIIGFCEKFAGSVRNMTLPTVRFDELHDMNRIWTESSVEGLTFSIGKYGINDMQITIGDEVNQRHNAVITGAVGQGKSNLISVIIHSLCQRYSPDELRLYLLDFKEGVTFKAFSDIGQREYLPHADALGLESDIHFGIAVMEALQEEYKKRMKILKDYNLKSIRELRKAHPEFIMPRIVAVIDEFQILFGDDMDSGQKAAELLEKSVRLFRAAGIHFILASQTLSGNMALAQHYDSIFSQIPIRVALKNSVRESQQTLSMDNTAAAFLRPREAIVNLDYGEVSQNRKTVVAFADDRILIPQRRIWWEKGRRKYHAPYVFESERRLTIAVASDLLRALRKEQAPPTAVFGQLISVRGDCIRIPMLREPGRNIAIIGTPDRECNQAVGIMQSAAISLAMTHPRGDARFLFCDFSGEQKSFENRYRSFVNALEHQGYFPEIIPADGFETTVSELLENPGTDVVYLFGIMMDRWEYQPDEFGQGTVLKTFAENGPAKNLHFIGWWIKEAAYSSQVAGFGNSQAFNTKVFLRTEERTVQALTSPFVRWTAQENRALVWDSVELTDPVTILPFGPVTTQDENILKRT